MAKGIGGLPDSTAQRLNIPPTPAAPVINATPTSRPGLLDGTISGVTDKMEYSTDGGTTWVVVPLAASFCNCLITLLPYR